jgi:hypothetical protein
MACLSAFDRDIFIVCANPIYPLSDLNSGILSFEVLEVDAGMLKRRLGKVEQYHFGSEPAFYGTVTSIEKCESTHQALSLMRHRPTVRVMLAVHQTKSQVAH